MCTLEGSKTKISSLEKIQREIMQYEMARGFFRHKFKLKCCFDYCISSIIGQALRLGVPFEKTIRKIKTRIIRRIKILGWKGKKHLQAEFPRNG